MKDFHMTNSSAKTAPAITKRAMKLTYQLVAKQLNALRQREWSGEPWGSAGLTWDVRRIFAPLGDTPAALLSYRGRRSNPESSPILQLPLRTIYPRLSAGALSYQAVVTHQLGMVAYAGASGKIFDAVTPDRVKDPLKHKRWEWAHIGIDLMQQQQQFEIHSEPGGIPQMPDVYAGFFRPNIAKLGGLDITLAIARLLVEDQEQARKWAASMTRNEMYATMQCIVNGKSVRDHLFIPPHTDQNSTEFWVIKQQYLEYIPHNVPLFEDFSRLCGVEDFNPAWRLGKTLKVFNPARLAAAKLGVNIVGNLVRMQAMQSPSVKGLSPEAAAAKLAVFRDEEAVVTDELCKLLPVMRKILGPLHHVFGDDSLLDGIMRPNQPLEQVLPTTMPMEECLRYGFGFIDYQMPHLTGKVDVADMRAAFTYQRQPLFVRRGCIVQHIDANEHGAVSMGESQLGRRVSLACC